MWVVRFLLFFVYSAVALNGFAQCDSVHLRVPFDFNILLSGNFGELRSDHFHSGVDFKTQGVVGHPIKCVADGYVTRASVRPGGYGQALYVMHDNGLMTVYAHLDRFTNVVAERVRDKQYAERSFTVDVTFEPNELRVEEGEILAYAGNSGYSFGPHLHFEVRDSSGVELYNPMLFYKDKIDDTIAPRASKVVVYPASGLGVVEGGAESLAYGVQNGVVADTVNVWGKIGLGIKALDYMNGTRNKYGVREIELLVDGVTRFRSCMDNFSFKENTLINAWVDYERYAKSGEWFQRSFVLENNPLRALQTDGNRGWVVVDEERLYNVEYRLSDYHGNESRVAFCLRGVRQALPDAEPCEHYLYWFLNNRVERDGVCLSVPGGELFESVGLNIGHSEGNFGFSRRFAVGDRLLPFRHRASLSLKVDSVHLVDTSKLYIRCVDGKKGFSVGGRYSCGRVTAEIARLGCYEVAIDTVAPELRPVNEKNWARSGRVLFYVKEKETRLESFNGTVDGNFILFAYSSKNGTLELDFKKEGVARGVHLLRLEVVDAYGNSTVYEKQIKY